MRKFFIGLMALALLGAFVAPEFASAAEVKLTGIFRWRGITTNDTDLNSRAQDSRQLYDSLARMRWTMKSKGAKVWAIYELDFQTGNHDVGSLGGGRVPVGVNRWLVDFAIPGTVLRARFGKTDWTDPTREIIGGAGRNRVEGQGIYGKLFGPVSISLWTTKTGEGVTAASDIDGYYVAFPWKAAPAITITPWFYWEHDNTGGTIAGTPDFDMYYYAVNAKAKFGIAALNVTGIIQDGDAEYGQFSGIQDQDLKGWAALIRLWLSFGKLKVGFYGHFFSGDNDATNATGRGGQQVDNELSRFVGPRNNGAGRLDGPQLRTSRRFSSERVGFAREARSGPGGGGANGNGAHIYEILFKYKLTKALELAGNISLIRSAAERQDIDLNLNGSSLDAGDSTFSNAKDIGTELDLSVKYTLYKSLFTRLTFAYFFAGDYGKCKSGACLPAAGVGAVRDADDAWALYSEIRHTFKSK